MRSNYWSCSKFADWLRGTDKLDAGTSREWRDWEQTAKVLHPVRYWIAEEALDRVQNFINWPVDKIYDMKYYVVNRWIDQSHALVAHPKNIKPGQYRDFDTRILYCLFDELVDFVEIEKAYNNYRWNEEKQKGMKWWQVGRWRTRTWRSAEAGIEYLKWEISLTNEEYLDANEKHLAKPTAQSIAAQEILDLYTWWTSVYPNRPDVHDASGWSAFCDAKRVKGLAFLEDDPDEDPEEKSAMLDKIRDLEAEYEREDTEMLIRLIKIRGHLWT